MLFVCRTSACIKLNISVDKYMMAGIWKDLPALSGHDHAVYLLARELSIGQDVRGEIIRVYAGYVGARIERLGCPMRRHLCRVIRFRHAIGAPKIVGATGIYYICVALESNRVVRDVICKLCNQRPNRNPLSRRLASGGYAGSVDWNSMARLSLLITHSVWVAYALADMYLRGRLPAVWLQDIALCR